ncbi:MAG: hypothetical protein NC400_11715 [Clostridium sp.]|nr:hypothetical protein [Clostridium sp.]
MSTLEKTISMIETLPEADLLKIQDLIQNFFLQREKESVDDTVGRLLRPMSKKDFLHDTETAEKEISGGKFKKADEVFNGLEQRYGF